MVARWFALGLLTIFGTAGIAGDYWTFIPAGERVVVLRATERGFELDRLTLPTGTYRFAVPLQGEMQKQIKLRQKGRHKPFDAAWFGSKKGALLQPGEYELFLADNTGAILPLSVKELKKLPYPTVTVTHVGTAFKLSPRKVKAGIVRFRLVNKFSSSGAEFGLRGGAPSLVIGKGEPVEVFTNLTEGTYSVEDIRMGLDSPDLIVRKDH